MVEVLVLVLAVVQSWCGRGASGGRVSRHRGGRGACGARRCSHGARGFDGNIWSIGGACARDARK